MYRVICLAIAIVGGLIGALGAPPAEARRVALVIGNAEYKVGPLANPVNDARAIAEAFERQLKFDKVILRTNLGAEAFRAALREMAQEVYGAEFGVVYFAGHGMEVGGRNVLIPVDAALARAGDVDLEAIPLDAVLGQLDGVKKLKLVILDACRNNPFSVAGARRSVTRGLGRIEPEDSTLVAYAAKEGTTAEDGKGNHSPFTEALLRRIASPVDVRRLFGYVGEDVLAATSRRQEPWLYGRLGGDELFLHPSATLGGARPAAVSPPQASEVERDWAAVKDTTSVAMLEAFMVRHNGTFQATLAQARVDELKRQVAVAVPPPPVQPTRVITPSNPPPQSPYCARSGNGETYCVSSVLAPQLGNTYGPNHLFDGNAQTAWVHGSGATGIGAWLAVIFERRRTVESIVVRNGYTKNEDIFSKNTRVRRMQLVFPDGQARSLELADSMSSQTLPVSPPVEAEWVQLRILEVYQGWKYADTALSELRVNSR
jgi:Caspase domain